MVFADCQCPAVQCFTINMRSPMLQQSNAACAASQSTNLCPDFGGQLVDDEMVVEHGLGW